MINTLSETTLPVYEKNTHRNGDLLGVRVFRSTYSVYYHRTNRGMSEIFDEQKGAFYQLFTKKKSVLDLGCGEGAFVQDLSRLGVNATGLDLHLNSAQQKSSFFKQGDAFQIPSAGGIFDTVLSAWSLFHYEPVSQIRKLMSEVYRVLAPEGSLLIPAMSDFERIYQIKLECRRLGMSANIQLGSNTIQCVKTIEYAK